MTNASDVREQQPATEIVARFSWEYRLKRYAMVVLFLIFGALCIKDGFFTYPEKNREAIEKKEKLPYPGYDIPLNRGLGMILPPLALVILVWAHYNSRGRYRLAGETLSVPGHENIPLDSIRPLDEKNLKLWDRKGLAYFTYAVPGTEKTRRFRLDDFVYERKPTDEMFEIIKARTNPGLVEPVEEEEQA